MDSSNIYLQRGFSVPGIHKQKPTWLESLQTVSYYFESRSSTWKLSVRAADWLAQTHMDYYCRHKVLGQVHGKSTTHRSQYVDFFTKTGSQSCNAGEQRSMCIIYFLQFIYLTKTAFKSQQLWYLSSTNNSAHTALRFDHNDTPTSGKWVCSSRLYMSIAILQTVRSLPARYFASASASADFTTLTFSASAFCTAASLCAEAHAN